MSNRTAEGILFDCHDKILRSRDGVP